MATDNADRLRRNAESKAVAEHDRQPWTADDEELLREFFPSAKGCAEAEAEVAEALGRTIEACRQRFYEQRQGRTLVRMKRTTTTTTEVSTYIGAGDDPDDCFWSPDYYK